ncbi:hypothetical protein M2260_000094 [Rhodococcus erythropolis]|nr:hypothetical protein [Rhodococcus erythropolis]
MRPNPPVLHSYDVAFQVAGALCAIAAVMSLLIAKRPKETVLVDSA